MNAKISRATIFGFTISTSIVVGVVMARIINFKIQNDLNVLGAQVVEEVTVPVEEKQKQLPEGFPAEFPVYPDSKLEDSWNLQEDGYKSFMVIWSSDDVFLEVSNYYKDILDISGWQTGTQINSDGSRVVSFKKDSVSGYITFSKDFTKTQIKGILGVGEKQR